MVSTVEAIIVVLLLVVVGLKLEKRINQSTFITQLKVGELQLNTHNVYRRHPMSAGIATVCVLYGIFHTLFMGDRDVSQLAYPDNPFTKTTKEMHKLMWGIDSMWLVFIAVVAGFLPLLELVAESKVQMPLHRSPRGSGSRSPTEKHIIRARPPWYADTVVYRAWRFLIPPTGLSNVSRNVLTVYIIWNILSVLIPLSIRWDRTPGWVKFVPDDSNVILTSTIVNGYHFCAVAAWPALYNYGLALLPIARTSPLLACAGMSYEETFGVHKLAGSAAIFWASVHAMVQVFPMIISWEFYKDRIWDARIQLGMWALWGNFSWFFQLIMAFFALRYFRAHHYFTFRAAHALFPLVFIFGIMHMTVCIDYFQLGMILYAADLAHRATTRRHATTGQAVEYTGSSSGGRMIRLTVAAGSISGVTADKCAGRFFYVHVPAVSQLEWHPFSVSECNSEEGTITFGINVSGVWTSKFSDLLAKRKEKGSMDPILKVCLEGPYGYDWKESARDRVHAGGIVSFVAGGLGIAPFACTVGYFADTAPELLQHMHVMWSVRDMEAVHMYEKQLTAAYRCGANILIHVTSRKCPGQLEIPKNFSPSSSSRSPAGAGVIRELWPVSEETIIATAPSSPIAYRHSAETLRMSTEDVESPSVYDVLSRGNSPHSSQANSRQTTPRRSKLPPSPQPDPEYLRKKALNSGKHNVWDPASPRWHWFVGSALLWLAIAGSIVGWAGALAVCGSKNIPQVDMLPLEIAYNQTVRLNYELMTGEAVGAGFWPKGQALFGEDLVFSCYLVGSEDELYMDCPPGKGITKYNPAYQYGHPLPCADSGRCWTCSTVLVPIFSWLTAFIFAAATGLLLTTAHEYDLNKTLAPPVKVDDTSKLSARTFDDIYLNKSGKGGGGADYLWSAGASPLKHENIMESLIASGRPDFCGYMHDLLTHYDDVDFYTCGSAVMQQAVQMSYEEMVDPATSTCTILPLVYSIGGS